MLRLLLNYLSQAAWARAIVQKWGFAKKTAARFVAGETLNQAIDTVRELNKKGIHATLDHLGEHVTSIQEARQAAEEILQIIDRLVIEDVASGVSVKLSQIGLVVDQAACEENLLRILQRAKEKGIFVRVDMEGSQLTQPTLDIFFRARSKGYQNQTGIAIQAYLRRSDADVRDLLDGGCRIRLCKGAYKEPNSIAFPKKSDVNQNFDQITEHLLDKSLEMQSRCSADGRFPPIPGIATHDESRVNHALAYAHRIGLSNQGLEFQLLYGIREDLQARLVEKGYPVRVYVPYGKEWYPYFVRRLAERPANLWFFLTNLFRG